MKSASQRYKMKNYDIICATLSWVFYPKNRTTDGQEYTKIYGLLQCTSITPLNSNTFLISTFDHKMFELPMRRRNAYRMYSIIHFKTHS